MFNYFLIILSCSIHALVICISKAEIMKWNIRWKNCMFLYENSHHVVSIPLSSIELSTPPANPYYTHNLPHPHPPIDKTCTEFQIYNPVFFHKCRLVGESPKRALFHVLEMETFSFCPYSSYFSASYFRPGRIQFLLCCIFNTSGNLRDGYSFFHP